MAITINALAQPQLTLPINTLAQLNCTTAGSSYEWTIVSKPDAAGGVALSDIYIQNPTVTPTVSGSYLIRCLIDGYIKEYALMAVQTVRSLLRIPAAGEGSPALGGYLAGTSSWALDANRFLRYVDQNIHRGELEICKNDSGGVLNKGDLVYVKGVDTVLSGLPEEHIVPTVAKASAAAVATLGNVGIVLGAAGLQSTSAADGGLIAILFSGLIEELDTSGFAAVGDTVYVSDVAGQFTTAAGTIEYRIGFVAKKDAAAGAITIAKGSASMMILAGGTGKQVAPTVVLGSKDAGDTLDDCDYLHENAVTDGITQAINAAKAASGGMLYIRRGTYQVPAAQDVYSLFGQVTIMGEGAHRTIIQFQNTSTTFNTYINVMNAYDVTIKDLTLQIPNADISANIDSVIYLNGYFRDILIENVKVKYGGTSTKLGKGVILVDNGSGGTTGAPSAVLNSVRINEEKTAVRVNAFYTVSSGVTLNNCYAYAKADFPAATTVLNAPGMSNMLVTGCKFETDHSVDGPAVYMVSCDNIMFHHNEVYGGYVELDSVVNSIIDGNKIDPHLLGAGTYGLSLTSMIMVKIKNNEIYGEDYGIYCTGSYDVYISQNSVSAGTNAISRGIILNDTYDSKVTDNEVMMDVSGNFAHVGIEIIDGYRVRVNNNKVEFNAAAVQSYGVVLRRVAVLVVDLTLNNNEVLVAGALCSGIYLDNGGTAFIESIAVNGNSVYVISTTAAVQGDASGIRLRNNTLKTSVVGNVIYIPATNVNTAGIYLDAGGAACTGVAGHNSITNAGGTNIPILPAGAPGTFLYDNNHIA